MMMSDINIAQNGAKARTCRGVHDKRIDICNL